MRSGGRAGLAVVAFAAVAIAGCRGTAPVQAESAAAPARSTSFEWPIPEGWRAETIPFPLGFAPDIPYGGVEELRFPAGMFKPDSPMYFSYAFVFWLEGSPDLSARALEENLGRYFLGLTRAVGEPKKLAFDPAKIAARLEPVDAAGRQVLGHPISALHGTIDTYDPFTTGKPLRLAAEVWTWRCPVAGHEVALFITSPRPREDSAWQALEERRASFACHTEP